MIIIHQPALLRSYLDRTSLINNTIGFVPTMGALHSGHISLIDESKRHCDVTVCSIFVNPTQFNDPSDYEKYPVTLNRDIEMLEKAGNDILFLPAPGQVYPDGTDSLEHYDLGYLETVMEGRYRPGHFQGVCQVMSRLLDLTKPHLLFMGQKDYQQCLVVNRLLELSRSRTRLVTCATKREPDGLAMSSRNLRLTPEQRSRAHHIYDALAQVKSRLSSEPLSVLKMNSTNYLTREGFKVDYFELANATDLTILETWDGRTKLVALTAAFLGDVRLIDNMIIAE